MAVNVYKAIMEPYIGETHYVLAIDGKEAIKKLMDWMDEQNKKRSPDGGEEYWNGIQSFQRLCEIDIE